MEFCKKLWVMDFGKTHRGRKRKNSMDVVRSENAQVNCYSITSSRRLPCQLPWREEFWHSLPINKPRVTRKIESPVTMPVFPLTSNWTTLGSDFWPRWEKSRFHGPRKYWNVEVIWVYSRDPSLLLPHFRCHHCLPQVSHWDPGHEASHFTQE